MAHTRQHKRRQELGEKLKKEKEEALENLRISEEVTRRAPPTRVGGLSERDRLELATERARRAELTPLETPTLVEREFVTGAEAGIITQRREQAAQAQAQEVLETPEQKEIREERERLFAEEAPVRRELDPTLDPGLGGDVEAIGGEAFPVVGPLGTLMKKKFRGLFDEGVELYGEDVFEVQPELMKNFALQEIENREVERGLTRSEKFGEFIEALGLGGLTNFIAEKPSENVQTILREVRTWKTIATDAESQAIRGTWTQAFAVEQVTEAENNIGRIKSRIRVLIQSSPEFKFNSDGVNFIETKLFEADTRIFNAKLAINEGISGDPNDIIVLMELQRSIDVEEFDIPGQ